MENIIEEDILIKMSNKKLKELIKNRGVFLYMKDGTMNEIRVKDVIGTNINNGNIIDYTSLSIFRIAIKKIEIIDL